MEEARGSDISKTQMDLVDLSAEQTQFPTATDDESFVKGEGKGFCVKVRNRISFCFNFITTTIH